MSSPRTSVDGQVVVITGAARGVGAALARTLAARGARLALVGLEADELRAVAEPLGGRAAWWEADVTDRTALERAAGEAVARFGRIDVVVAGAGVAAGGPFLDCDPADFDRVVQVNLLGSANTARAFLPALTASRGHLLQIASLAAITPAPLMAAYCASKAGVESFAHCLRAEFGHKGVTVGVAYLSWTDTDMVRGADEDDAFREMRRRLPWPTGRTYPLAPAVERIATGIVRRSAHVYGQRWLRATQLVRGGLPSVVGGALGRREMRYAEAVIARGGAVRRGLVGRGGAADDAARAAGRHAP